MIRSEKFNKKANLSLIKTKQVGIEYDTGHSMDHLVAIAHPVYDLYFSNFKAALELSKTIPELHEK